MACTEGRLRIGSVRLDVLLTLHPGRVLMPVIENPFPFPNGRMFLLTVCKIGHLKRISLNVIEPHLVTTRLTRRAIKSLGKRILRGADAARLKFR